jgi:rhodanese-related sulfurtransferase
MLDPEMAAIVEKYLESKGVQVLTSTTVQEFKGDDTVQNVITDRKILNADLVVLAIGVKPNVKLAADAGLEIGETGAIKVDSRMCTSDPDIYASGDCCECTNIVTGRPCFVPLGSTANKQGRVAANNICGIDDTFPGVAGSSVCKIFDFSVARSGLGEKSAVENGYEPVCCYAPAPDKAHFIKSARPLFIKLIADRKSRKLLGAQAVGVGVADKRMDVIATALSAGLTVDQLANLDLCYAPPFSPAVDNILTAANILRNKLDGRMAGITADEVREKIDNNEKIILLDVRSPKELEQLPTIPGALNIPLGQLRNKLDQLGDDKNVEIIAFCKISLRGYEASIILKNAGFNNVKVMEGGMLMWPYKK